MTAIIICILIGISTLKILKILNDILDNQMIIYDVEKNILENMTIIQKDVVDTINHVEETLKLSEETSKNVIKFFDELMIEEENK